MLLHRADGGRAFRHAEPDRMAAAASHTRSRIARSQAPPATSRRTCPGELAGRRRSNPQERADTNGVGRIVRMKVRLAAREGAPEIA